MEGTKGEEGGAGTCISSPPSPRPETVSPQTSAATFQIIMSRNCTLPEK